MRCSKMMPYSVTAVHGFHLFERVFLVFLASEVGSWSHVMGAIFLKDVIDMVTNVFPIFDVVYCGISTCGTNDGQDIVVFVVESGSDHAKIIRTCVSSWGLRMLFESVRSWV